MIVERSAFYDDRGPTRPRLKAKKDPSRNLVNLPPESRPRLMKQADSVANDRVDSLARYSKTPALLVTITGKSGTS